MDRFLKMYRLALGAATGVLFTVWFCGIHTVHQGVIIGAGVVILVDVIVIMSKD